MSDPNPTSDDEEHGFLRDDGEKDRPGPKSTAAGNPGRLDDSPNPVVSPDDERHPNAPGTLNADKGPRAGEETANSKAVNTDELGDAYSRNDPGVTTKP